MYNNPFFPVRIALSTVLIISLVFTVMFAWYITQPVAIKMLREAEDVADDQDWSTTGSTQSYTILRYIVNVWGPAFVVVILIAWALASTQRTDYRGEYY